MHDSTAARLCALFACFQSISRRLEREAWPMRRASFELQPVLGLHAAPGWKSVGERFTVMHVWVMHNRVCCVLVMSVK